MSDNNAAQNRNSDFHQTSFLQGLNAGYIENLYAQFVKNPASVDADLADFFKSLNDPANDVALNAKGAGWARDNWPIEKRDENTSALDGNWTETIKKAAEKAEKKFGADPAAIKKAVLNSIRAIMLIRAFRVRGHLIANLDPLGLTQKQPHPELDPASYGFKPEDKDALIHLDGVLGLQEAKLSDILNILHRTYGGSFAVEFMHIYDPEEKAWLQQRIEGPDKEIQFSPETKKQIFQKLVEAEGFEKFLHTKYMGTKRFGLDGGESLIPGMEQMIHIAARSGTEQIVIGMPHRGRLNILVSVMGKPYQALLNEFQGGSVTPDDVGGSGDVKYHLGASSDREIEGKNLHLSLLANPSHLEAVNPVVIGKARRKQEYHDDDTSKVIPVLLHGDAAFAGQGVVAECFALSGLIGYKTGGTVHIIVNNQIGFTTSPHFARSSPYPSDVAKGVQAPIFHVNGDDPEAVAFAFKVATEYRQKFSKDVVIDLFCYRRYGHNEGDEPAFTQPSMYKAIRNKETVLTLYTRKLEAENILKPGESDKALNDFANKMSEAFEAAKHYKPNKADWLDGRWGKIARAESPEEDRRGVTAVSEEILKEIGRKLTEIPEGFNVHRTLKRVLDGRRNSFETGEKIDWASAESLAFGSLVCEGHPVRLSGQDCGRGTFSQRHASMVDQENDSRHIPANNLRPGKQAPFTVLDSPLSEYAVLGFEYGYSWEDPNALVLWEAQFGDFANGAQVMIDQFISSAESKWLRMSGLVMLLPHGYEGQGPEHSSARLERYLQLCAEDNMQVANCTTPANYFHILRRQIHRNFRKPLIIVTPKSLLRHKLCLSDLSEMTGSSVFHRILTDDAAKPGANRTLAPDDKIRRIVICSGKVYYDLYEEREARQINDVYLLRVEQLYPFPVRSLIKELQRFKNAEVIWCQEEPRNMGAWQSVEYYIEWCLAHVENAAVSRPRYVGRPPSASTATGSAYKHKTEQEKLIDEALKI